MTNSIHTKTKILIMCSDFLAHFNGLEKLTHCQKKLEPYFKACLHYFQKHWSHFSDTFFLISHISFSFLRTRSSSSMACEIRGKKTNPSQIAKLRHALFTFALFFGSLLLSLKASFVSWANFFSIFTCFGLDDKVPCNIPYALMLWIKDDVPCNVPYSLMLWIRL